MRNVLINAHNLLTCSLRQWNWIFLSVKVWFLQLCPKNKCYKSEIDSLNLQWTSVKIRLYCSLLICCELDVWIWYIFSIKHEICRLFCRLTDGRRLELKDNSQKSLGAYLQTFLLTWMNVCLWADKTQSPSEQNKEWSFDM